jgi:hypothetical protein
MAPISPRNIYMKKAKPSERSPETGGGDFSQDCFRDWKLLEFFELMAGNQY